jgi:hypothetical protein
MAYITTAAGAEVRIMFNLFALKQRLQSLLGSEISLSQIARDAALHRNTVERIFHNKTDRIDLETLGKLLIYFQSHGLEMHVGDFFLIDNL